MDIFSWYTVEVKLVQNLVNCLYQELKCSCELLLHLPQPSMEGNIIQIIIFCCSMLYFVILQLSVAAILFGFHFCELVIFLVVELEKDVEYQI